jgi:8-oxo-dGTP pyrophosphatase MutT (NUDIX family)
MSLAERLRTALAREADPVTLYSPLGEAIGPEGLRPAAVLIAVTDRPEPGLLLTLRQPHLSRHAGQIAFPGGRIDPDDTDPPAAALREAWEEIGLDPRDVELVGEINPVRLGTGFAVTPVVGVVPPDLPLRPQESEVAAIFEVPLAHVLTSGHHLERRVLHEGRERRFYEISWQERVIWGATAGMIVNLAERLDGAFP